MKRTKSKRKSASRWEENGERALLKIWANKMDALRGCRKNSHILLEMVTKLHARGFKYSVFEIKTKMHNMTARYRKDKQIRCNGGSPSEWYLYNEMEVLLEQYEGNHADKMQDDSIYDTNSSKHQITPKCENDYYEFVNENFFQYDNEDNDRKSEDEQEQYEDDYEEDDDDDDLLREEGENGARTSSTHSSECNTSRTNDNSITFLKAINSNLKLMTAKVNELSSNMQSYEERGNAQLMQISNMLSTPKTKLNGHLIKDTISRKRKRCSLSDNDDDDALEDITKFIEGLPTFDTSANDSHMKSYAVHRNKIILDDYLKTKQLEREFMTEKHNIQMEILKLELDAKRKEILKHDD